MSFEGVHVTSIGWHWHFYFGMYVVLTVLNKFQTLQQLIHKFVYTVSTFKKVHGIKEINTSL